MAYTYYDVRGRIETVEVTRADGRSQTKRYDRDGWPLEETLTDSDGTVTSYTYELVKDPSPHAMAQALLRMPV